MFNWWKNRKAKKKQSLRKKLNVRIKLLERSLEDSETMYNIKTKQYDDFMLASQKELDKVFDLLDVEKASNGGAIRAKTEQIRELNVTIKELKKDLKDSKENNNTLRTTLGHF